MVKAPQYLRPETRRWWRQVVAEYDLEPHHLRLLTLAAEVWDRYQAARATLDELGLTYEYKGRPHARPEVAIERDSRLAFARLLRELALDVEAPAESRPPMIGGRRER
ncbi:MAG: hypothetical protein E6J42_11015 [Chloroflexi bacterium]|nr:MAG: hypothetical protein E6J42_11015 [Chloroflexota bacterium]